MKRYVYDRQGINLLRVEEAQPTCHDTCDRCGECLNCFGDDECWVMDQSMPEHFWVVYEDEIPHPPTLSAQEQNHAERSGSL